MDREAGSWVLLAKMKQMHNNQKVQSRHYLIYWSRWHCFNFRWRKLPINICDPSAQNQS